MASPLCFNGETEGEKKGDAEPNQAHPRPSGQSGPSPDRAHLGSACRHPGHRRLSRSRPRVPRRGRRAVRPWQSPPPSGEEVVAPPTEREVEKKIKKEKEGEKKGGSYLGLSRLLSVTVVLLLRHGRIEVREVPGDKLTPASLRRKFSPSLSHCSHPGEGHPSAAVAGAAAGRGSVGLLRGAPRVVGLLRGARPTSRTPFDSSGTTSEEVQGLPFCRSEVGASPGGGSPHGGTARGRRGRGEAKREEGWEKGSAGGKRRRKKGDRAPGGDGGGRERGEWRRRGEKSLVLLKNGKFTDNPLLPLPKKAKKILVAGSHADNLGCQCGGWTITWQGRSGNNLTIGTTILDAIKAIVDTTTKVVYSGKLSKWNLD
ncbi:uncharacterized protein LOC120107820 isoform X2 [Phoenix dactylifera]|uniref:Uncharacterized protein LOC120107820 isoform X2 n=1 Tax=Phoenix dactylifera TaxID=42345 RepID=A0A8B8ZV24_PHODC|nr:uncharacterized protein LOC120107820 isoform X2 [Phoenix dactylifera]